MVERLFLSVPWGCLQFVIAVFPDHTHLLFFTVYAGDIKKQIYFQDKNIGGISAMYVKKNSSFFSVYWV